MVVSETGSLHELAALYGISTSYYDAEGRLRRASGEALLAVLQSIGAPVSRIEDVASAVRQRRLSVWNRPVDPVYVAWEDAPANVYVRMPAHEPGESHLHGTLTLQDGATQSLHWRTADLPVTDSEEVEGERYVARQAPLPSLIPLGYHRLVIDGACGPAESLVISAPRKGHLPCGPESRTWGAFLPLYSLHSQRSWGCGDFTDLDNLMEWTAGLGGNLVATLPLLASFLDTPFEPSPYAPASRLFWNELYIDPAKAPELQRCPQARELLASMAPQAEIESLRQMQLVDYRRIMALKRQVMEELARCCYSRASGRLDELQHFARANPALEDYARFRAACQKQRSAWPVWASPAREGMLSDADFDEDVKRYHVYVQWLAQEQIEAIAKNGQQQGVKLYFDLPLGAHPDSYDVWREREAFAMGMSTGAPPDPIFSGGQDWGFPPPHPERMREQGYRYFINCIRHQMRCAGVLRIDHIMGFHRLFWVPRGMKATEGVYVRYHPEEFYAIVALESSRNKTMIIGEDLGTVPAEVRPAMADHGLHRTYVLEFALNADPERPLEPVSEGMAAMVDTHDLPSFAAFWQAMDIDERVDMGLLKPDAARDEKGWREAVKRAVVEHLQRQNPSIGGTDMQGILAALLSHLGAGPAHVVLVNLEDLWLETRRQNLPGTVASDAHPNWRRKAQYSFETFSRMPQVADTLRRLNYQRRKGPP